MKGFHFILKVFMIFLTCNNITTASSHLLIHINSIQEGKEYLKNSSEKTLVLIDVDSTLTTPSDRYLRRHSIRDNQNTYDELIKPLSFNQNRIFNHLLVMESPSQLVEKEWPSVIKDLQEEGIKCLALTAAKTGPISSLLASFPEWRYGELSRLGIDFSSSFPGTILFDELEDYGGDHPGIEKGIIYCGHKASKGELLPHILKAIDYVPSSIIFIDDKKDNLESLSKAIKDFSSSISFTGIDYTAIENIDKPLTNPSIFKERFSKLVDLTKNISP